MVLLNSFQRERNPFFQQLMRRARASPPPQYRDDRYCGSGM